MSVMPTEGTETAPEENEGTTETEETTKPSETLDFWKAKAREQEKRAKANADAAKRLAEIEEAQKSEAEKAADRLAAEKDRADTAERLALSLRIATEHKLGADDAQLLQGLPDEASMQKLAKRLAAQEQAQPRRGNRVPGEGTTTPKAPADENREFVRHLFGTSA